MNTAVVSQDSLNEVMVLVKEAAGRENCNLEKLVKASWLCDNQNVNHCHRLTGGPSQLTGRRPYCPKILPLQLSSVYFHYSVDVPRFKRSPC